MKFANFIRLFAILMLPLNTHAGVSMLEYELDAADDKTPLMLAAERGDEKAVSQLLSSSHKVNTQTQNGITALMLGSAAGHANIVGRLLSAGANPNLATESGITALVHAANSRSSTTIEALLKAQANPNAVPKDWALTDPPLLICVAGNDEVCTNLLLKSGARTNVKSYTNETPLSLAVRHGNSKIAKLLLANGADIAETKKINSFDGQSARSYAKKRGYHEVISLLDSYTSSVNKAKGN